MGAAQKRATSAPTTTANTPSITARMISREVAGSDPSETTPTWTRADTMPPAAPARKIQSGSIRSAPMTPA